MTPTYVIIADPHSLRYSFFERDLRRWWGDRGIAPEIQLITWQDVCVADGRIDHVLPRHNALLRIESPARDFDVIRELLRAGQRSIGQCESDWTEGLHGWIASPRLIFNGLRSCLRGIEKSLSSQTEVVSPAKPSDVALLFDKNETSTRLRDAGLPVPESFQPTGNAETLIEEVKARNWSKAYVKLAYGSCASGIVVLAPHANPESGITTVERISGLFYNSYDVRAVVGEELISILNFILDETATVQQAIPKTQVSGRNFDLRVVVLAGKVIAVVCRVSDHPMTNLHLGGQRGDPEECRRRIGQRHWLDAMDCCCQAASLFDLPCVGIDVAFDRNSGTPYILEMNSFGDFFPNWKAPSGKTIHELEIEHYASYVDH